MMNCRGCGGHLEWTDGAYCSPCMRYAQEVVRLREIAQFAESQRDRLAATQLLERAGVKPDQPAQLKGENDG